MALDFLDKAKAVRVGEEINSPFFLNFLEDTLAEYHGKIEILQFPSGYSNLTYLIKKGPSEFVLRKPPHGANIKSAHDMNREYKVLSLLKPVYDKIPAPISIYEDDDLLGAPFYLMERVKGLILRDEIPKGMTIPADSFHRLSINTIDTLAELHRLDIKETGLDDLGVPEGYVQRQVDGWIKRYFNAETDEIEAMNSTAIWMQSNLPPKARPAFIHNDYKYDNLALDPETLEIKAILDWEMATVGDPLMDLGTSLGYWAEKGDPPALKSFGVTGYPGNLTRQEIVEQYANVSGINTDYIVFYYVFGCFKIAVIAQQIYARYKRGLTKDPRFAGLKYVTNACAENAANAIKFNRINNFT